MTLCSYLPYLLLERQTHFPIVNSLHVIRASVTVVTLQPTHSRYLHSDRLGEPPGSLAAAFLKDSFAPSFPPPGPSVTSWAICPVLYRSGSGNGR